MEDDKDNMVDADIPEPRRCRTATYCDDVWSAEGFYKSSHPVAWSMDGPMLRAATMATAMIVSIWISRATQAHQIGDPSGHSASFSSTNLEQ